MKNYLALEKKILQILILAVSFFLASCQKNGKPIYYFPNKAPNTEYYPSTVATDWFLLLTELQRTTPYIPPYALRIFSYSSLALYESVLPGMPSYQSLYKYYTGNTIQYDKKKDYFWPACANAALAGIATKMANTYPNPNLAAIQDLETRINNSFLSIITTEQLQQSIEFGKMVADSVFNWSMTDGTFLASGEQRPACSLVYVPPTTPGSWVPTFPGFGNANGFCLSQRTFVPDIYSTSFLPAPLMYSDDPASDYYSQGQEVYSLNAAINETDLRAFRSWGEGAPACYVAPSHAIRLGTQVLRKEEVNLEKAAVLLVKQAFAMYDGNASGFGLKFDFGIMRPITYIRNVLGHTTWNSTFNTPTNPSYPDELCTPSAAFVILEKEFGKNYPVIDSVNQTKYGIFSYGSIGEMIDHFADVRVKGGWAFRFTAESGIAHARAVANAVERLPFKK